MVFRLKVTRPESAAARIWNFAQSACGTVSVVLIVLKLTGVIALSWWWVLAPLWLGGFLLAVVLCAVLALLVFNWRETYRARRWLRRY